MEKTLKSIATNFGLYLGAFLALITIIPYAVNIELLINTWLGGFILITIIAFGIVSVAKVKQAQNSYATFKEAFTAYFITVALGLFISILVSYILFNFIDPEAAAVLKEITIEKTVQMMEGFNSPSDIIDQAVENMEAQNNYSLANIAKSLAGYLVMFSIIGLIVAAAMKKKHPDAE